jgi:predicted PurR-regulated permease PerM
MTKQTLFRLIIEVLIYAALVSGYLALVLHFLVSWLQELFAKQRVAYAFVAILLMIVQSVGLERVVSALVHVTRRRREP